MSVKETSILDECECVIYKSTIGQDVIDLTPILEKKNLLCYDFGFVNTASCESKITYIDGDRGILMHRGYKIEDLTANKNFLEVAYLILHGNLPTKGGFEIFKAELDSIKPEIELIHKIVDLMPDGSHPMSIVMAFMSALAGKRYQDKTRTNYQKALDAIKQTMYVTSAVNCRVTEREFNPSKNDEYFTNAFLRMSLDEKIANSKVIQEAIDKIFILHADHEQNASTSAVRLAESTKCGLYSSLVSGFGALWGPLHGGANEAVLKMLQEIGKKENVKDFIEKVKNKVDGVRLMGFGHRIYKNYDPRATGIKEFCPKILLETGVKDSLLEVAVEIEKIALSDEYFIQRKLFPNVDFYSGIIYKAIGIPVEMFTPMFAMARTIGWCAHWLEAVSSLDQKLWRPSQLYTGEIERKI